MLIQPNNPLSPQARFRPWNWAPGGIADPTLRQAMRAAVVFYPLWERSLQVRDYAGNRETTISNSAVVATRDGFGVESPTAGAPLVESWRITGDPLGGLGAFTVLAAVDFNGQSGSSQCPFGLWETGDTRFLWRVSNSTLKIRCIAAVSGGNADVTAAGDIPSSGTCVIGVRYNGSELSLWLDGVKDSNTATSSGTMGAANGNYCVGYNTDSAATTHQEWGGYHYMLAVVAEALSDAQIAYVSRNWRGLSDQGRRRSYFIPAAAGGGSTTDVPLTTFSVSPQAPTTLRSLISNVPTL